MLLRFIHVVTRGNTLFFLCPSSDHEGGSIVFVPRLMDGWMDCFHLLDFVNNYSCITAINVDITVCGGCQVFSSPRKRIKNLSRQHCVPTRCETALSTSHLMSQ